MDAGHSSAYAFLSNEHNLPLPGVRDQGDLIPFQRLVLIEQAKKEQEEIENEQPQSGGQSPNQFAQPNGGQRRTDTVTYINDNGDTK